MNFFEQQDHARRQTKMLVLLFALAVLAIVLAVNFAMALIFIYAQGASFFGAHAYPRGFFAANTLVTLILIGGGTLLEMFNLRDGGDAVARMAGGRMVELNTRDAYERRLLNVVEEMALASGIACPRVYLLDKEESINAFAAGYNPNEAVLAVTRGTLDRLTRDELQGVIAHEFSHILNGDMRLNIRLVGVLFGIQMFADFGRQIMETGALATEEDSVVRKRTPLHIAVFVVGFTLFAIGYIGLFFGRIIKSAVSRHREFLADASAIQFTRNRDGLGSALRKIGRLMNEGSAVSQIRHRNAEQLSHFFLSAVRPDLLTGWFATHPSLSERLRRIYGRDVAMLDAPRLVVSNAPSGHAAFADIPYAATALVEAVEHVAAASDEIVAVATQAYGGSTLVKIRLSAEIDQAVHEPYVAPLLVYALLLDPARQQSPQRQCLLEYLPQQVAQVEQLAAAIARLPANSHLPLLDLVIPALRQLSIADRAAMLAQFERMIASDSRVSLNEFVLQTVLVRRLAAQANRAVAVKYFAVTELKQECLVLFSLIAHVAAPLLQQPASSLFIRAADFSPHLFLSETDLMTVASLNYGRIKTALDKANQLAPLANPALIKSLLAIASEQPLPLALADVLRAMCAAIEAPMPPAVAAVYTDVGWPEASLS